MSITTELINARIDLWCDIYQLPDTTWLRWYNDSRDELIDSIIEEKEDYFYTYWDWVFVIWQNEYNLPKRWDMSSDVVPVALDWLVKLLWVSAKFKSTDTDFIKLEPHKLENLEYDISNYTSSSIPFYVVLDDSVFIYPTPTEETTYRLHWIYYPKKLALSDNDTLQDFITKNIFYWIAWRYFASTKEFDKSQVALDKFEKWKVKACKSLSWRIQAPIQRTTPNLNNLK